MEFITKLLGLALTFFVTATLAAPVVQQQATRAGEAAPALKEQQDIARANVIPADDTRAAFNWAGYVATEGTYTAVSGTWIVPEVRNPMGNGADAAWVGVGGVGTHDLIQAGTESLPTDDGGIMYAAWYELLPDDSKIVPLTVRPGDSVSVNVSEERPNRWLISFKNNSTGDTYQKRVFYESSYSSAEWIEEMPLSPDIPITLNDFGVVQFISGTAVRNGETVTIAEAGAEPLRMENDARETIAIPSELGSDGKSFSVARTEAEAEPLQYVRRMPWQEVSAVAGESAVGDSGYEGIFQEDGWYVIIIRLFDLENVW